MIALYTVLYACLVLLAAPLLPLILLWPRSRRGLLERLGVLPKVLREQALLSEGCVWVHAASLGEVNAVAPVVRELMPKLPRLALVVTCTTIAGREQARRAFPQAAACLLVPLDLPWLIRPWIHRFKPRLALIAETELWPNLLSAFRDFGSQILVANGRLTERSARRYGRLGRPFAALLEKVDLFAMQAQEDADRLLKLGARPARVVVAGNTKFDLSVDPGILLAEASQRRRDLGWPEGAPVIVAGSTRSGEEALFLKAFQALIKALPGARLVLAPRHLERVGEVEALLKAGRWSYARRSRGGETSKADVLLLDTLGELRVFYGLAASAGAAWVGGSFKDFGGQNPLEPAALGVPVLFGPFMRHFPEAAQVLLTCGGAEQWEIGGLAAATEDLLRHEPRRAAMASAAREGVASRAGASQRTAELGLKLLLVARMRRDDQDWRAQGQDSFRSVTEFGSVAGSPDWQSASELPVGSREFGLGLRESKEHEKD